MSNYYRKTVDYYKIEVFLDGEWRTLSDTNVKNWYDSLMYALKRNNVRCRGCKYRKPKSSI